MLLQTIERLTNEATVLQNLLNEVKTRRSDVLQSIEENGTNEDLEYHDKDLWYVINRLEKILNH